MRVCLLDTVTKKVINVVSLDRPEDHNPTPGIEVAPQHDGDIGWTWTGSGWDYPQPPAPTIEQLEEKQRELRDKWLRIHVDTINAVRWQTLTQQQKDDMIAYRQALLDVPQQVGFPTSVTWPTPPEL
jgi:hypothetical protein